MLCSKCSEHVEPVVVFDIDGTLADYHTAFYNFCVTYWDLPRPYQEVCGWDGNGDFEEYIGITKAQYREAKLAYRQGGSKRSLSAYPGLLAEALTLQYQAELWVATTRPWNSLSNIDPDTQEWLRRNSLKPKGLLYGETKYQQLLEAVDKDRIVACIEDLPDQFDMAAGLDLPVIQIMRNHNMAPHCERTPRGTVTIVAAWVQDRLDQWRQEHRS